MASDRIRFLNPRCRPFVVCMDVDGFKMKYFTLLLYLIILGIIFVSCDGKIKKKNSVPALKICVN